MKNHIIAISVLLGVLVPMGCKKDSSASVTKPSLGGLEIQKAPAFVAAGTTLTFKAGVGAIYASDDTSPVVGLCWQVNSAPKDTLTKDVRKSNPDFLYQVDTLGKYTVTCFAFAIGDYYPSSAATSFQAVDPSTVLSGVAAADEITVNGLTWKARNLGHNTLGRSFRGSPVLDGALGRLFSWEEAQTACPDGWHLPSVAEFQTSFAGTDGSIPSQDLMADASFLGEKMWEYIPGIAINNKYGFNAIPLGYIDSTDSIYTYDRYGEYAMWWTSDQNGSEGTYLYIFEEYAEVRKAHGDKKSLAMSVRCVKD